MAKVNSKSQISLSDTYRHGISLSDTYRHSVAIKHPISRKSIITPRSSSRWLFRWITWNSRWTPPWNHRDWARHRVATPKPTWNIVNPRLVYCMDMGPDWVYLMFWRLLTSYFLANGKSFNSFSTFIFSKFDKSSFLLRHNWILEPEQLPYFFLIFKRWLF